MKLKKSDFSNYLTNSITPQPGCAIVYCLDRELIGDKDKGCQYSLSSDNITDSEWAKN